LKYLIATIAALVFIACVAKAARSAEAVNITVIDGDTFRASIELGFGVVLKDQTVRIYKFDAWETAKHRQTLDLSPLEWNEEIRKGISAKFALEKLLKEAKKVEVREVQGRDPWGRLLLECYADGLHVGDTMTAKGHARKILVGKEAKPDSPAP
jgi:endonuclease YncB( thermonuclease family)